MTSTPPARPRDAKATATAVAVGAAALVLFVVGLVTASTTVPVHLDDNRLGTVDGHAITAMSGGVHVAELTGVQRVASDLTAPAVGLLLLAFVLYEVVRRLRAPVDIAGDDLGRLASLLVTAGVLPALLGLLLDAWVLSGIESHARWTWLEVRAPGVVSAYVLLGAYILVIERRDRRRSLYEARSAARDVTPTVWEQRLADLADDDSGTA